MANEELNISKDKARLTVIGNSYPDVLTDSGFGFDIPELIVDALDELGIELPDWGPTVPPDLVIGLDTDVEPGFPPIPTLKYPDPEWEEPEWPDPDIPNHDWPEPDWPDNDLPDILDYPLPELDWDDFIDKLEELGQNLDYDFDPNALTDLSFVGLDDLGIPTLVSLDMDFNIREDNCPESIVIVTPPYKTEYTDGKRIDLTGMVVTAKKADGSTWTSAKYPNGHIPLGELIVEPMVTSYEECVIPDAIIDDDPVFDDGTGNYISDSIIQETKNEGDVWSGTVAGGTGTVELIQEDYPKRWHITMNYGGKTIGPFIYYYGDIAFRTELKTDGSSVFRQYRTGDPSYGNSIRLTKEETDAYLDIDTSGETGIQQITVSWKTPCFQSIENSFNVMVRGKRGNGGR